MNDADIRSALSTNAMALSLVRQRVEPPDPVPEGESWPPGLGSADQWRVMGSSGIARPTGCGPDDRWRVLPLLLASECRHARLAGRRDEALQTCGVLLRFGRLVAATPGSFYEHLLGVRALRTGLAPVRDLARDVGTDRTTLEQLAVWLRELPQPADAFTRALKREYVEQVGMDDLGLDAYRPEEEPPVMRLFRLVPSYSLQPVATRAQLTRAYRCAITNATVAQASNRAIHPEGALLRRQAARLVAPNAGGVFVVSQVETRLEYALCQHRGLVTDIAATRVVVAAQRFRLSTGRLPLTLEALVPEFIDAVPADPYDGKPLRYLPERGIVYAVDTDMVDDGGEVPPPPEGHAEDAARNKHPVRDRVYWVVAPNRAAE